MLEKLRDVIRFSRGKHGPPAAPPFPLPLDTKCIQESIEGLGFAFQLVDVTAILQGDGSSRG